MWHSKKHTLALAKNAYKDTNQELCVLWWFNEFKNGWKASEDRAIYRNVQPLKNC